MSAADFRPLEFFGYDKDHNLLYVDPQYGFLYNVKLVGTVQLDTEKIETFKRLPPNPHRKSEPVPGCPGVYVTECATKGEN